MTEGVGAVCRLDIDPSVVGRGDGCVDAGSKTAGKRRLNGFLLCRARSGVIIDIVKDFTYTVAVAAHAPRGQVGAANAGL